jgi:O-antigen/teichoic acid export membrane protein
MYIITHVYIYYFDNNLIMKQYTKYIKNEVIALSIVSLAAITIISGFLNLENTSGYWLLLIGSTVVIGYFYLRYNYQRKINRLDPGVLESLK